MDSHANFEAGASHQSGSRTQDPTTATTDAPSALPEGQTFEGSDQSRESHGSQFDVGEGLETAYDDGLKTPTSQTPSSADLRTSIQSPGSPQLIRQLQESTASAPQTNVETGDCLPTGSDSQARSADGAQVASSSQALHQLKDMITANAPTGLTYSNALDDPSSILKDKLSEPVTFPQHGFQNMPPTSVPSLQPTSTLSGSDPSDLSPNPSQTARVFPTRPNHPHPVRTRTSSPRESRHYPGSNASSASDLAQLPAGAKTVGNTPAQSPGLLSPTLITKKPVLESDEGHYTTPMLHSTHLQAPKETHRLLKDIDPVSGRKLVNNYELFHKLGSGQHGTVKLGRNIETGERVAVKIVRRFSKKVRLGRVGDPNDMIKKEVAILKKARHSHVVSLFEVIDDEEFSKVYLILEYVERGEIVWRKPTEKAIAMFEKERLERENLGGFDAVEFQAAVDHFNSNVSLRREEKTRIREEARAANQHLESQHPRRKVSVGDHFWSLEYGGESEPESASEATFSHLQHEADTRMSRADIHAAETAKQSPQSATPVHTPRSHPHPSNTEQLPSSQPGSRPDSPSVLEGSFYAGHSDDGKASDLDLHYTLDQIIANQIQWSEDEENYRYVPCLTLTQARDAFRDTVLGLEFLHYQGIMHRDIKPANLLWTRDYRVKISDFGVSYLGKPIREDETSDPNLDEDIELAKTVGTPAFYAPELCDPDFYDTEKQCERPAITGQIDVWALGVTLYCMIFGRLPFFHPNEFQMYEKIARDEVFIPRMRLKGVEHNDEQGAHHHKRPDDVLEYEEIDDTLRDLVKRLLAKKPSQRITLKEVKHHPWVIKGIDDMEKWLDQTDPSRQSEGEKIEPSEAEIKEAVIGVLPMLDRFKTSVQGNLQRLGSVFRGRGSRKRTDSNIKYPDSTGSASSSNPNDRRSSLRGDEQIFSALRASREGSEHPLSHSVAVSPEQRPGSQYFSDVSGNHLIGGLGGSDSDRTSGTDHAMSTADSVKTIRPHTGSHVREAPPASDTPTYQEEFSGTTPFVESHHSSASSISNILAAPGRFIGNIRSRERGLTGSSPSHSSRSSSVEASGNREELHAHPSLAVSSAVAAGHVDQPQVLREENEVQPPRSNPSSTEAFQRAQEQNWRRYAVEQSRPAMHRRSISMQAAEVACPPSPDDETFSQPRPASAADSSLGFPAISSSSDMIVSGESAAHSRIPSVVSGASSLSAAPGEDEIDNQQHLAKRFGSPAFGERDGTSNVIGKSAVADEQSNMQMARNSASDEAGYNGEPEDSDSEDEGLAMA